MNANEILQRGTEIFRETARVTGRVGQRVIGDAFGVVRRVQHVRSQPKPEMDDVTLSQKVETEIFRGTRTLKATVNVNAVDGVVFLRGEVKRPEQIRSLERKARAVPEVRGVENLLHLTKTPAPTRADTPARQQRTRSTTRRPTPRRGTGRVTDDRTDAIVGGEEPSPAEHALAREGRTPAPFGSHAPGGGEAGLGVPGGESGGGIPGGESGGGIPGGESGGGIPGGESGTEALPPAGGAPEEEA